MESSQIEHNFIGIFESSTDKHSKQAQIEAIVGHQANISIFPLAVEFLQPAPYPGPDYTTIALLLEVKITQGLSSMGFIYLNTDDEAIAWATWVGDTNPDSDAVIIMASFPLAAIKSVLPIEFLIRSMSI